MLLGHPKHLHCPGDMIQIFVHLHSSGDQTGHHAVPEMTLFNLSNQFLPWFYY